MNLTGKCKECFEKWYLKAYHEGHSKNDKILQLLVFKSKKDSMQYGVYVDFFDSVGIYIQLTPYFDPFNEVMLWFFTLENKKCMNLNSHIENGKIPTRQESRNAAIEKANEIYNKQ